MGNSGLPKCDQKLLQMVQEGQYALVSYIGTHLKSKRKSAMKERNVYFITWK
jgi:hypothetical protein